jgi:hypothetical protein
MYSIASVFDALGSKKDIALEDDDGVVLEDDKRLRCPLSKNRCYYYKKPDDCEKGNSQSCKQPVIVFYKHKKLRILFFKFKISITNRDGFIPKDDSALSTVIKYCQIDKSLLKSP